MSPLARLATRVAYGASQLPRVTWYIGHSLAVRRLSELARRQDSRKVRPRAHTTAPVPNRRQLYADMAILLRQDLANVEAHCFTARGFSSRISPKSIGAARAAHTAKF
jgi:hypothetical protein